MHNKNIKQGKYIIKHPEKYLGSLSTHSKTSAYYRSSWELIAFEYMDKSPSIKKWGSEIIKIPYHFQMDDLTNKTKKRYYYIDLYYETVEGKHYLIEIKPKKELSRPTLKKKTLQFYNEAKTYIQNTNKWDAAKLYAKQHHCEFQIWDEDAINHIKRIIF